MSHRGLIVGVLDTSGRYRDKDLVAKLRDLTIACCRFDFQGPLLESDSVDDLLDLAACSGYGHCLIQSYGHVMVRHQDARRGIDTDFIKALEGWVGSHDFFVAGRLRDGQERWYGLDDLSFVVDLKDYETFGRPEFSPVVEGPRSLPVAAPVVVETSEGPALRGLRPTEERRAHSPGLPGWNFIATSLEHGKEVLGFDDLLLRCGYDLRPKSRSDLETFHAYRGEGIFDYHSGAGTSLSPDWKGFLDFVQDQAKHAKRGIFLGNWEGYRDVEQPPEDFQGPVSTLYGVAAGFKVNRILETHGFGSQTRVVFFDYSEMALELKRLLVEGWDGTDYPGFIERAAERLPGAFYQLRGNLWDTSEPGSLDLEQVSRIWDHELETWGGERAFRRHWLRVRELEHRFVHCDLFSAPDPLLDLLEPRETAVLWWSNAFHSLNGVWFYPREEREEIYRRWLRRLATINPNLLLYGADAQNLDIGGTRVRDHLNGVIGPLTRETARARP